MAETTPFDVKLDSIKSMLTEDFGLQVNGVLQSTADPKRNPNHFVEAAQVPLEVEDDGFKYTFMLRFAKTPPTQFTRLLNSFRREADGSHFEMEVSDPKFSKPVKFSVNDNEDIYEIVSFLGDRYNAAYLSKSENSIDNPKPPALRA